MTTHPLSARLAAWGVHLYTAIGVVLGLAMVERAYAGETRTVLWLFIAAMFIDGTDGMLARHFRVKEVVPMIDGALLDNIVDYLTYAFAPMVLLLAGGYLPEGVWGAVLAGLPLLASCYQFCRVDAKTDDHFFLGFPSYWNVLAFYVVVWDTSTTVTAILLVVFTILVFVPLKYLYPTRTEPLFLVTMGLSAAWMVCYIVITATLPNEPGWLVVVSLGYIVYVVTASLWLTRVRRLAAVQG